jgi:anti-sigma regulatory factor (Ser/Thr protein kinase)
MVASPSNTPEVANPGMDWKLLSEINLPSQPGADHLAMELVARIIEDLHLPPGRLVQLKQAVAVATSNAAKKRESTTAGLPLSIRILTTRQLMEIQSDDASSTENSSQSSIVSSEENVSKKESLRGWGFFIIDKTLDDPTLNQEGTRHRIELYIYLEGGRNASRKG